MKKYILKYIIPVAFIAVLGMTFNACSDDYLDETETYDIDSENYFNSETDYYNALVAAYDLLQATYVNVMLGEIASDNTLCGGESATDVIGFQQIDDMIHSPVNSNLRDVWNWMFAGVNRANYILEFQDKTDFEGKEIYIAEARFLSSLELKCALVVIITVGLFLNKKCEDKRRHFLMHLNLSILFYPPKMVWARF